jgi:hypothetical protein
MFIIGLMFVYGKFSTVITVQTIFCCNPNETVPVLIYLINQTTGEFFVSSDNLGDCPLHNKETIIIESEYIFLSYRIVVCCTKKTKNLI